jgi:hypothetical protein
MRALFFGIVAMAVGGCFDPDKPAASGTDAADSSGTSGGSCAAGGSGCPCYGNGTCDSGLECNASVGLCIPEDCDPGSEGCTCNDGACLAGLECDAGVCVTPSATTDPATTDVTTDPATTDPATTDPATTDPATTDVTTDPATTDVTTDSDPTTTDATDTDPVMCEGECPACVDCLNGPGGACEAEAAGCGADKQCVGLVDCCSGGDSELCALCCLEFPAAAAIYNAYLACFDASGQCAGCNPQMACP